MLLFYMFYINSVPEQRIMFKKMNDTPKHSTKSHFLRKFDLLKKSNTIYEPEIFDSCNQRNSLISPFSKLKSSAQIINKLNSLYYNFTFFRCYSVKSDYFLEETDSLLKLAIEIKENELLGEIKLIRRPEEVYENISLKKFRDMIYLLNKLNFSVVKLINNEDELSVEKCLFGYSLFSFEKIKIFEFVNLHQLPNMIDQYTLRTVLFQRELIIFHLDTILNKKYNLSVFKQFNCLRLQVKSFTCFCNFLFYKIKNLEMQAKVFFSLNEEGLNSLKEVKQLKLTYEVDYSDFDSEKFNSLDKLKVLHFELIAKKENLLKLIKKVFEFRKKDTDIIIEDRSISFYNTSKFNEEVENASYSNNSSKIYTDNFKSALKSFDKKIQSFKFLILDNKKITLKFYRSDSKLIDLLCKTEYEKSLEIWVD